MKIIYEPKGPAKEYAPLALNIYKGCVHGCVYCYAPEACRISKEKYFSSANPKEHVVERVREDAVKLAKAHDDREILISFIGDPYQPAEAELKLTMQVIKILIEHGLAFSILTKGGDLAMRDFEIYEDYPGARFGVTMTLHKTQSLARWEPDVDSYLLRRRALQVAHDFGIQTWVSVEPVIYPQEALDIIEDTLLFVDYYKIGRINYFPEFNGVDWSKFREDAVNTLVEWETNYYIKRSLQDPASPEGYAVAREGIDGTRAKRVAP